MSGHKTTVSLCVPYDADNVTITHSSFTEELNITISYLSVAMIKHHGQSNLQKEVFIWGLWFQRAKGSSSSQWRSMAADRHGGWSKLRAHTVNFSQKVEWANLKWCTFFKFLKSVPNDILPFSKSTPHNPSPNIATTWEPNIQMFQWIHQNQVTFNPKINVIACM